MKLTVRDVSQILKVSESMVTRWIKKRGLPARQVGDQFRFNRTELFEWATANQLEFSPELFERFDDDEEPPPQLAGALDAGGVFYRLPGTDKNAALSALVRVLPLPEGLDRELLLSLFLSRETLASTAIGNGIALPHVRNPIVLHVSRPMLILGFLEQPVDFGALDGKPVQVLFSIVCPTTRNHLQLLSRLAYALQDAKFRDAVMRRAARDEILTEARRVDSLLGLRPADGGKAAAT